MTPEIPYLRNTPQNFYILAWEQRLKFVQALVDGGEKDPYRIMKILERHEEKYNLGMETATGSLKNSETGEVLEKFEVLTGNAEWLPIAEESDEELLPTGRPMRTQNSFLGDKLTLPAYTDIKGIVANWVIDLLEDGCQAIVELGCGYGRNLFNIHYFGGPRDIPYYAAEFTDSGKDLTRLLASLRNSIDMRVAHFDHTDVDTGFLQDEDHVVIFTCHSIEQVAEIPATYFADLARAAKKLTCIHFEPFGFQISPENIFSARQKAMFLERDWNVNFFSVLKAAAESGSINLTHVYKDIIPNEDVSPTSVAIWRNY